MFDRIKKAFAKPGSEPAQPSALSAFEPVSQWAAPQGFAFSTNESGHGISLEGQVGSRP
jgi:hypothetical protein